jgi:hypothetical protein
MQFRPTPQTPDIAIEEIADSPENTGIKAKDLFKRVMIVAELLAKSGQEPPVKSTRKTPAKTQN